jgi:acetolactate synthase regulatory subunit
MTYTLPLSFSVEPDSTLDTLEMVLAVARRIGLRLAQLELRPANQVFIDLHAADDDALALFCARLHNVIGVHDVHMHVASSAKISDTASVS